MSGTKFSRQVIIEPDESGGYVMCEGTGKIGFTVRRQKGSQSIM